MEEEERVSNNKSSRQGERHPFISKIRNPALPIRQEEKKGREGKPDWKERKKELLR